MVFFKQTLIFFYHRERTRILLFATRQNAASQDRSLRYLAQSYILRFMIIGNNWREVIKKRGETGHLTRLFIPGYDIEFFIKGVTIFFYICRWNHAKKSGKLHSEVFNIIYTHPKRRLVYVTTGA